VQRQQAQQFNAGITGATHYAYLYHVAIQILFYSQWSNEFDHAATVSGSAVE
jgi:hypothetical protein